MFYSQLILARKGPLGKIWLAAHWDKKITKHSVLATDISESVESILDPSTPLALRVSGHLMLGVVRIYARKVKYLMADVTEVMWKVKMAYNMPGATAMATVDMAETAPNAAIDDPRYFGNIPTEYDFPELVDTAFSQNMLTQYNELKAARGRTLNTLFSQQAQETSVLLSGRKKDRGFGEEDLSSVGAESHSSRVSDIEYMRGEKSRSTLPSVARTSMSSAGMKFIEDELPAFIEDAEAAGGDYGYAPMDYDDQPVMHYDDEPYAYEAPALPTGPIAFDSPLLPSSVKSVMTPEGTIDASSETSSVVQQVTAKRKVALKRKRVMVNLDERVELSAHVIKEQLNNRALILRRQPGEKLPRRPAPEDQYTADQLLSMPSIRDLCPELLELFQMTMTMGPLPFPLLHPVEAFQDQQAEDAASEVEVPRRDRDRSIGRASLMEEEGYDKDQEQDYPREEDYGGGPVYYDDYVPPMDEEPFQRPAYEEVPASPLNISKGSEAEEDALFETSGEGQPGEGVSVKIATIEACSARTAKVIQILKDKFEDRDQMSFKELAGSNSRRNAATCFFEILQLNTWGLISADQSESFGAITLRPTEKLWVTAQ